MTRPPAVLLGPGTREWRAKGARRRRAAGQESVFCQPVKSYVRPPPPPRPLTLPLLLLLPNQNAYRRDPNFRNEVRQEGPGAPGERGVVLGCCSWFLTPRSLLPSMRAASSAAVATPLSTARPLAPPSLTVRLPTLQNWRRPQERSDSPLPLRLSGWWITWFQFISVVYSALLPRPPGMLTAACC